MTKWRLAAAVTAAIAIAAGTGDAKEPVDSVIVYAPGAANDAVPLRTIRGPRTGLAFPSAVIVGGDALFVANRASNSVTVYASDADGDAAPVRTIGGPHTGLDKPTGIAVDHSGDVHSSTGPATTSPCMLRAPTATPFRCAGSAAGARISALRRASRSTLREASTSRI